MSPPFLKRVKTVLAVVPAIALLASPLAYASPMGGFLPHNIARTVYPYGTAVDVDSGFPCHVTVQHGNVYGAAYAKIKSNNINCYKIRISVTALKNGRLVSSSTGTITNPKRGRWYQATVNLSNIVGSGLYTQDEYGRTKNWSYAGI